jgi:hypothetical protein
MTIAERERREPGKTTRVTESATPASPGKRALTDAFSADGGGHGRGQGPGQGMMSTGDFSGQLQAERDARQPTGNVKFRAPKPTDISAILADLQLEGTGARDLSPLNGLALESLNLSSTPLDDISALGSVAELRTLALGQTRVTDVRGLHGAIRLERLDLRGTAVTDLTPLGELPALAFLDVQGAAVDDEQVAKLRERRPALVIVREPPRRHDRYQPRRPGSCTSTTIRSGDSRGPSRARSPTPSSSCGSRWLEPSEAVEQLAGSSGVRPDSRPGCGRRRA